MPNDGEDQGFVFAVVPARWQERVPVIMAPFAAPHRHCIIALALLAMPATFLRAQGETAYSNRRTFNIPFSIEANDRRVQQLILNVSEDNGRTYQQAATANPGDKGFTFSARHDGWHSFAVQTMDQDRKLNPPSLDNVVPGLRVLIKTVPPEIKLRPLAGTKHGEVGLEWDIRDEALDVNTLRLEFRAQGQLWQERQIDRSDRGQARWEPGFSGPVEVRMQVKDRAGNLGEATTRITPDSTRPMNPADDTVPAEAPVRKINTTRISLNYKLEDVGPSDISIVEIWKTRDGKTWQRYPKDADKKGPFIVEVDGEGRYGFTLIAKSGVGLGENAPRAGDQPQIWVEVDLTKPEVRIADVVVGRGPDTGNMTVTWTATDRNLSRQPISILYATKIEGPWLPVPGATRIENTGRFVWKMQADVPFEFFVRVEASDEAGNVGQAETAHSVKVDLSTPRARVIGIDPVKP
jgi:hypothetical protein